jgi:hypothetical protein
MRARRALKSKMGGLIMNPKRSFRFFGLMALGLLAASLVPATASAQVFKGYFTLPVETRWGKAVLPPGTYTLTLNSQAFPNIASVQGEKMHVLVMPSVVDAGRTTGPCKVFIARFNGKARIRGLQLGTIGATYWYAVPKGELELLAYTPALVERLPIIRGGK